MKKILATSLLACTFYCAQAQQEKWDSTHRPNQFAMKVEQFRGYPNSPEDIIFLGNSITAGTDWMELLENKHARNRGISGDITFGVLERLDEVTEGKPSKIFILVGINDIARNIPDSVIAGNYEKMIARIRKESPHTKIYFQTLLPVNNELKPARNHFNKDEHILNVNRLLKILCKREKVECIDLYPHFLSQDNKLEKNYTYDGLHLNPEGYKIWAAILKERYLNVED